LVVYMIKNGENLDTMFYKQMYVTKTI